MDIFGKKMEKKRVYQFQDEREFFSLIEQRLNEQGYQLLDTLKRITRNSPLDSPRLSP